MTPGEPTIDTERASAGTLYDIEFPSDALDQDEEWCTVRIDGRQRRIRFHDYGEIYDQPGLYEQLFYHHLECTSPPTVIGLLSEQLREAGVDPADLVALDVGAGNGMVGEELASAGVGSIVGIDIIEAAAEAAERDRPGLYDEYRVVDLTDIPPTTQVELESRGFNALTCVAALGFGDIPPVAFAAAYDLIAPGGWLAFCIKEDFLNGDGSPFARQIAELRERGMIDVRAERRYRHRRSAAGAPLHYVAMVAVKASDRSAMPLAQTA